MDTAAELRAERLPTQIYADSEQASVAVAHQIAELIRRKAAAGQMCVLGLATGSTPTRLYEELVRLHQQEGLSFRNVISFNLDEYYPMRPDSLQSYVRFMHEYLFDQLDIQPENIHIPDGTIAQEQVAEFCRRYEEQIRAAGGIDLQVLGIGRTGHIGFNEPGSGAASRTRLITLDHITRTDAASDFYGEENVPRRALTMGVGTILEARQIVLLAWGEGKAAVVKRMVEGDMSDSVPATYLQQHKAVQVVLDAAASAELTRVKTPWLVGKALNWQDAATVRKGVTWLARTLQKPILKLTDEDYNENGLSALLAESGLAYDINIRVFRQLQRTITGWPGGKPHADDTDRPERAAPFPKRVLIFSPHPDDDVISMGGTLLRLVDQGHEVHVAYQTSGNIAVFDDEAIRFAEFVAEYDEAFRLDEQPAEALYRRVADFLHHKHPGQVDSAEVQQIKRLIRRGEAKSACRYAGIPDQNVHFMDLPFYETGRVRKKPIGEADIRLTVELLERIRPHQVYAAGDLSDPHGTHRVCLAAIFEAIRRLQAAQAGWLPDCRVWLYRGAWQEWDVDQIEMAVPLSPQELTRKRRAIFKHQSQKDRPLFPGADQREFWQRAEERNRTTARLYDQLGLPEYEGLEAFVRWKFELPAIESQETDLGTVRHDE
ncbi:glucosamine-6-phosphate deaminase [Hymenobacter luteus]|uniref:Glucosamine-6-phosphate deaminase n=2 Tax=Hymenobacter TaxID=89966 RepID=A0A7W9T415_9BACT|nr:MULTISPECIES: glucosamine-6-phosphate deaminase [Hymenobacter]MBB4603396.1 glucosamine-6-phosphate deaminase [Hymenobacter latericoloratus]MBB6061046.1 glucosamine-6-phosphate deaminase [Hymenobacter luteus]